MLPFFAASFTTAWAAEYKIHVMLGPGVHAVNFDDKPLSGPATFTTTPLPANFIKVHFYPDIELQNGTVLYLDVSPNQGLIYS